MNETIVVGVTDAAASRRAVDWAIQRAADSGDRIQLVAVVGGAVGVRGEEPVLKRALAATEGLLDAEAQRVKARGVPLTTRVGRGKPVDELIAASAGASLLVIGSDYRGEGSGPVRGPYGVRITAGAHSPVIVVPDVDLEGRSGVVVGVDGLESSEAAIGFAASEADRYRDSLTAISVWSPFAIPLEIRSYPEDYLQSMQALTEEMLSISLAGIAQQYPDLIVKRVVVPGTPHAVINEHAVHARLTVVGSHGRGSIARFLLGSTSQEVLARLATTTAVVR